MTLRLPLKLLATTLLAALCLNAVAPLALADEHIDQKAADAAYDEWLDTFGDWTLKDVEDAGYEIEEPCVTAAMAGAPAELGAMGRHAINMDNATSGKLDIAKPHVILLDENDKVVGVEYEVHEVSDPAPTVGGIPLLFTPPHEGMEYDHMSLHVFFVGDEDQRFGTWNTAVSCPKAEKMAEEMAAAADDKDDDADADDGDEADSEDDDGDHEGMSGTDADDSDSADHDATHMHEGAMDAVAPASAVEGMPTTGIAELPGGRSGVLLLATALLMGMALAGGLLGRRHEL
jgi:hypothetical protein